MGTYKDLFSVSYTVGISNDEYLEPIPISLFLIVNDHEVFLAITTMKILCSMTSNEPKIMM